MGPKQLGNKYYVDWSTKNNLEPSYKWGGGESCFFRYMNWQNKRVMGDNASIVSA